MVFCIISGAWHPSIHISYRVKRLERVNVKNRSWEKPFSAQVTFFSSSKYLTLNLNLLERNLEDRWESSAGYGVAVGSRNSFLRCHWTHSFRDLQKVIKYSAVWPCCTAGKRTHALSIWRMLRFILAVVMTLCGFTCGEREGGRETLFISEMLI